MGGSVAPGMAVGFLFIPVFNMYWLLVAFCGLPFAYKRYHGVDNGGCPVSITLMILQAVSLVNSLVTTWLQFSGEADFDTLIFLQALGWIVEIGVLILMIILMCKVRTQGVKLVTEGPTQFY